MVLVDNYSQLVLSDGSTSVLKFLIDQRVAIERETKQRLFSIVEHIPKTCPSVDLLLTYLNKEAESHSEFANRLSSLTDDKVKGGEAMVKTLEALKSFHSSAVIQLDQLQSQLVNASRATENKESSLISLSFDNSPNSYKDSFATLTPTTNTSATNIKPIKPPSQVSSSGNHKWFGRRKKKNDGKSSQSSSGSRKDKSSREDESTEQKVDEEGYSIRPQMNNDDLDSFYSSSDDGAVGENNDNTEALQPIKFEIKPLSSADIRSRTPQDVKASTEELRDKALNLVIPEKPLKRLRVPGGDVKNRNTVDVSEMLGMKHSLSQRSLQSEGSALSDYDSLPPPIKPPPTSNTKRVSELFPSSQMGSARPSADASRSSSFDDPNPPPHEFTKQVPSSQDLTASVNSPLAAPPVLPARKPASSTLGKVVEGATVSLAAPPVPPPRPPQTSVQSNWNEPSVPPPALPPKLPPKRTSFSQRDSTALDRFSFISRSSNISDTTTQAPGIRRESNASSTSASFSPTMSPGKNGPSSRELPLSFSFHEKISAIIKSEDITSSTVQIQGSLNLLFPVGHVDRILNLHLGKICFEVPQLLAFQESININCLQPLVQLREKEAVDDPVVYEIEPTALIEYINTRPLMELYQIKLIEYQIKVDKSSQGVEESMHLAPLQIMSYCKSAPLNLINVKIEYMYNEGAFPKDKQPVLCETAILAKVVDTSRDVQDVTCDPEAVWDAENRQAVWQLGMVSPSPSTCASPGPHSSSGSGTRGSGVLKAKFTMKSPGNESSELGQLALVGDGLSASSGGKFKRQVAIGARFRCEGSVTGITVNLLESPSEHQYRISNIIHNTTTGQYISLCV